MKDDEIVGRMMMAAVGAEEGGADLRIEEGSGV